MTRNSLKKKTNKKGFTLVELIMVVALIAILAAIAVPTVSNVIDTANKNVDAANAQTVELAIKTAHAELSAKTWVPSPAIDPDDLTVAEALKHKGIPTLPEKKVSASKWGYGNGKIYLGSGGNGITYPDDDDDFIGLTVKAVLNIT